MVDDGLAEPEARSRIFMVDRFGLLTDDMTNLLDFQKNLLTARDAVCSWQVDAKNISLLDVVKNAHPTVMIGVSGQPGSYRLDPGCRAGGHRQPVRPGILGE